MIDMMKNNSDFFIQVTAIRPTPRTQEVKRAVSGRAKDFSQATPACGASSRLISLSFRRRP